MDSTMVHQIVSGATQLGMSAKGAFGWWILYRLVSDALTAAVILMIFWRGFRLAETFGEGQAFVRTVSEVTGRSYPSSSDYVKARDLLKRHWRASGPDGH